MVIEVLFDCLVVVALMTVPVMALIEIDRRRHEREIAQVLAAGNDREEEPL